jgi:hypothetical protein
MQFLAVFTWLSGAILQLSSWTPPSATCVLSKLTRPRCSIPASALNRSFCDDLLTLILSSAASVDSKLRSFALSPAPAVVQKTTYCSNQLMIEAALVRYHCSV